MKINGENLKTLAVFPIMMTVPDCVVIGSNKLGEGMVKQNFILLQRKICMTFMGKKDF